MRGLAGIIRFDQVPVRAEEIGRMIRLMAVGPTDRIAHWSQDSAGLAYLGRNFVAEDRFDRQPLCSADGGVTMVADALLERRDQLAHTLGLPPNAASSLSDSELILRAYLKWDERCPEHLEGKFAFAAWHARERRLFAAADPFAFRPFYYCRMRDFFAFATTLRGLLSLTGVSRTVDEDSLAGFLLYSREHGQTLYRDIKSLPAAHRLQLNASSLTVSRYWRPDPNRKIRLASPDEYVEAFRAELELAVAESLRVEGNVGIRVSGGLDSAAIAAVAGALMSRSGRRLQAIHLLPDGNDPRRAPLRDHDESRYVRAMQSVAPHIDFHYIPRRPAGRTSLARSEQAYAEHWVPVRGFASDQVESPLGELSLARVLDGLGGNYLVSLEGYPSGYFAQLAVRLRWGRLARELKGHRGFYGYSLKHLLRHRVLAPLFPLRRTYGERASLIPYLQPDFIRRTSFEERLKQDRFLRWDIKNLDVNRRLAWIMTELMPQTKGIMPSVLSSKATADAYSPFFNRRLNEFCLAVPVAQQIRDGRDRLLLRESMKGLLPAEVIWRTSRGFPMEGAWTGHQRLLRELPEALDAMSKSALVSSCLNLDQVRRHLLPTPDRGAQFLKPYFFSDLISLGWFLQWLEKSSPVQ